MLMRVWLDSLAGSPLFEDWRHGTEIALPLSIGSGLRWDEFPVPGVIRDIGNALLHSGLPSWIPEVRRHSFIPNLRELLLMCLIRG